MSSRRVLARESISCDVRGGGEEAKEESRELPEMWEKSERAKRAWRPTRGVSRWGFPRRTASMRLAASAAAASPPVVWPCGGDLLRRTPRRTIDPAGPAKRLWM
jgi:hypothetical protein